MSKGQLLPQQDDDDKDEKRHDLKTKKEKVIQPLTNSSTDPIITGQTFEEIHGASDELLKELRAKTAELASKVAGPISQKERVLKIEDDKDPKDIYAELEVTSEKAKKKPKESQNNDHSEKDDPAVSLVRDKLAKLFKKEPDTAEEAIEAYQAGNERSEHQQFMYDLTTSGKSLADIQTEWHNYYTELPENQKHEVWKEFYDNQRRTSHYASARRQESEKSQPEVQQGQTSKPTLKKKPSSPKTISQVKAQILDKISAGGKLKAKHHIKSLLFGVGLASIVGLIITFTFFNEVFIAPFISPSQSVSATPIIGSQDTPVGDESKIIIPKINLEVPVVFGLNSINEKDIQNALEDGVVHYSSTPNPGENGNSVIVGHSSNNILNSGKYKFAFVLLKRLESEDIFFVEKDNVRYTYKIYKKEVVKPDDTSVLQTQDKANTMTLITCDPPGTSINRLIITAEQILPNPNKNKASTAKVYDTKEAILPSNAPSLWSRIWPF